MTALFLAVAACGGGRASDNGAPGGINPTDHAPLSPTASSTSAAQTTPKDPQLVAQQLQAAIPDIGAIVKITEDNDQNNLIGRPGQHDAAVFMQDKRLGCSAADDYQQLSIDCGAKIERWPTRTDAQHRADDIQKKLKALGLGAEYDWVRGRLLLRVAGALKPTDADAYMTALVGSG